MNFSCIMLVSGSCDGLMPFCIFITKIKKLACLEEPVPNINESSLLRKASKHLDTYIAINSFERSDFVRNIKNHIITYWFCDILELNQTTFYIQTFA